MEVEFHPRGIFLPQIDLWLDCTETCDNTWISHGHSDHAYGLHGNVWGTAPTLEIYRARWPGMVECCPVKPNEPWQHNGATLTAIPASHIVGAAQLLIDYRGERLLYTGDIKLREPICGSNTEVVACDRLIIESTFGLPIYHFLGAIKRESESLHSPVNVWIPV